jgi:hypothetical protein
VQDNQCRTIFSSRTGLLAAGLALTVIGALPAAAQNYDSISSPAQRRACTPDVYRLCAGEIPSVPKITACLRRKKASLSDACRVAMGEQ